MNFKNILHEIEQATPEVYEKKSDRRNLLKGLGSKVALAAVPLAISSLFDNKAYGKTTDSILTALNYILELEYFQYNFYHTALATGSNTTTTLIPVADRAGFEMIEAHQKAHITFLRNTIKAMGSVPFTPHLYTADPLIGNPYTPPSYDFTAHSAFHIYEDYDTFLALAQAFEDMIVRAYQGQLNNLLVNTNDILTEVVQMSTVEARHAAYIRNLRRDRGAVDIPKPWITNNVAPNINLINFYLQEDNVVQKGIDVTTLTGTSGNTISFTAATEAFDEPLDKTTVESLIAPFKL